MEAQSTILAQTLATRVSRGCHRDRETARSYFIPSIQASPGSRGRVSHADSKLNGGILRHDCGFLCPNATDAFSRINARSPRRVRIACAGRCSFTTSICFYWSPARVRRSIARCSQ